MVGEYCNECACHKTGKVYCYKCIPQGVYSCSEFVQSCNECNWKGPEYCKITGKKESD